MTQAVYTSHINDYDTRSLWSEVLPNLWQGGTAYENMKSYSTYGRINPDQFDVVFSMCAYSNPVLDGVLEVRRTIRDGNMDDFNPEVDLYPIVVMAHNEWKNGKKVLIRCAAGLNRSGLLMALVLIREGYTAPEAIELIRDKRSKSALFNKTFVDWLLGINVEFWRN